MIGIEINNEFLDLPPGTSMELVEENPFLQFAEDVTVGNYSFPVEFVLNEKNTRLTGYAGIIQKKIDLTGIEARLYGNGIQHSRGRLKIEKIPHNLNSLDRGRVSAYYLTGSSDFYQDIKSKKLREIDLGGDRTFAWDDFATSGPGFWGHITTVARSDTPQAYDYCFFPVKNSAWKETLHGIPPLMNDIRFILGELKWNELVTAEAINTVVPFPWLHYVLKKAVEYTGWTITGEILSDPNFLKICLINFQAVNWGRETYSYMTSGSIPNDPVTFNLQDHLPDISISQFLTALRKRFGWWYDFNFNQKKITIRKIYDAAVTEVKDMTKYASPLVTKSVTQDRKIYSLKNIFSTDLANGSPSFANVKLQGAVNSVDDLPAPDDANYTHAYLVRTDNNYYICTLNEAGDALEWQFYAYNIYDYIPEGATDEITTEATTVGMEKGNDFYLDLVPRVDFAGNWDGKSEADPNWSIILCFYHGKVLNHDGDPYNYGSSHIYDWQLNQVADWALSYSCQKTDGSEVGLYELNWKPFLNILGAAEQFEAILNLPFHEALKLKFSDRIVIENVMMFVKQIKRILPYTGKLEIEAVRIL
jgi:hypothetical protein